DAEGYLLSVTGAQPGTTTTFTYDGLGRVRTVTDADGYTVTLSYDALDRVVRTDYPDGSHRATSYARPSDGKMTLDAWVARDRQGRETRTEYDGLRRVTRVTDAAGRVTTFGWCNCDGLATLTDAKGQTTTWTRDVQGRVTSKALADGATTTYAYEATTSRLKSMTDAKGQRTNFAYLLDDNVQSISYTNASGQPLTPPTPGVSFTYDADFNRLTGMTDGVGTTTYEYYPVNGQLGAGQVKRVDGPLVNDTLTYTYDALGRMASRSVGTGNAQAMTYDNLGRVTSLTNLLGTFTPTYDGVTGRVLELLYPNGQKTQMSYADNVGDRRLTALG
ncbi:MAG: hypothetical protein NZ585_14880, partial [Chloracidobacterium sp.]|nr:hypothetical protein [Chloracidobacterium sp.]